MTRRGVGAGMPDRELFEDLEAGRDRLLTPAAVAALWDVDPKTITRWASEGRLPSVRTPGGHRRYRASVVRALFIAGQGRVDGGDEL